MLNHARIAGFTTALSLTCVSAYGFGRIAAGAASLSALFVFIPVQLLAIVALAGEFALEVFDDDDELDIKPLTVQVLVLAALWTVTAFVTLGLS